MYVHAQPALSGSADPGLESDLPPFQVGSPADAVDARRRHDLGPDGLPNAAGAWIPDRVRLQLPVLLAARLREIVRVVFSAHDDCRIAGRAFEKWREVNGERRVATLMTSGEPIVAPHRR